METYCRLCWEQLVEIIYAANSLNASGSYRIFSNDSDEPEIICETNGNIDGANVGEPAPDFDLNYVGNGSGNFQLSDHLGEIIIIAFLSCIMIICPYFIRFIRTRI